MMDGFEERVEASFGSLGRSPVAGTQTQDGGGATGDRETSEIWRLDKNPCFRSSSQPLEADTSAAEEAAERIRRACGPSSSEESEEGEESDGGDVERQSEKADPDYDESVGVRASFAFCSQIDREAERDEADVASLQFDFEAGATMNPALAPWGPVSMDPTAASLRSALKGGRGREVLAQRQVSFDLPPLPKPWLPPHKRGVIAPESDGAEAKTGTDTVPDYVKHPDRYVKYEFDEPAVMGGST